MEFTDDQFIELHNRKDISFITLTNYGYLHYAKNLILSLEKCNFPLSLKVYCIDQKSFDELQACGNITVEMLNDETNTNETIVGWKEKGWGTMVFSKLKCIHRELLTNPYVLFTDSDIVFEDNYCLQYLLDTLKEYDMCIQQNTDKSTYPLNTGFMLLQSNDSMKQLFDWSKIDINTFTCDQDYINDNKEKFNYFVLPRKLFPTEKDYYYLWIKPEPFHPYIIHFNKHRSDKKIIYFKKSGKWYLD
tara:strand:+ start:853 stop:1590 length:738 start_codon:yes stop_codon:yes gene_type:complete